MFWVWFNVQSGKPAAVIEAPSAAAVQAKTGFPPIGGPFRTRAQAEAFLKSCGDLQKTTPTVPNPVKSAENAVANSLGLPKLHNLRDLMVRVIKVVLGASMIIIGLVEIAKPGQVLSKLPVPVPV